MGLLSTAAGFSMKLLSKEAITTSLMSGAEYKEFTTAGAESVASFAKSRAPGLEGDYISPKGSKVLFANPHRVWHLVEFGSINNQAYSPLRRGVVDAGLRLEVAPKP